MSQTTVGKLVRRSQTKSEMSIGQMLLDLGKITAEDAECILRLQKEQGVRFGEAAKQLGLVTEEDIRQVLALQFDYPYLRAGEGGYPSELVAAYQPFSMEVEALRALRSQLILRWFAQGKKTLGIVGIDAQDGTSYLAANLAVVFSQLGEQTLLIDANLRCPRQHELFNLKDRLGLSDILADRAGLDVVSRIHSFVALSVLQAGTLPPNPQELINRTSFCELNRKAAAQYDVILYDLPSFSTSADAYTLASETDGVILVVRKDKTKLTDIGNICEQLVGVGVAVVGAVYNAF